MNKNKLFAVILCALMVGGAATGCSFKKSSEDENSSSVSQDSKPEKPSSENSKTESSKEDSAENSSEAEKEEEKIIKIKSYSLTKDYSGKDALLITYEWTNTEDKATSFMFTITDKLYQNGVQLESAVGVDEVDAQRQLNEIKPGVTYEVSAAFILQDKSDVTVECSDLFGTEMYLEETISLENA